MMPGLIDRIKGLFPIAGFSGLFRKKMIRIDDPRDALLDVGKAYYCYLPVSLGRVGFFYSLDKDSLHPYFVAAREALKAEKDHQKVIFDVLKSYDDLLEVRNANDFFGLSDHQVFPVDSEHFHGVFPWRGQSVEKNFLSLKKNLMKENKRWGVKSASDLGFGDQDKVFAESQRLSSLLHSIKKSGYSEAVNHLVDAEIFLKGNTFMWSVKGGHHRAAVFSALNLGDVIPARVSRFVRYEDLEHWPNVRNGVYSREAADECFHRFYNADPPGSHDQWVAFCKAGQVHGLSKQRLLK